MQLFKYKKKIIYFLLITFGFALFLKTTVFDNSQEIFIDKHLRFYYKNKNMMKGKFFFTLRTYQDTPKFSLDSNNQLRSYLIVLSDAGVILHMSATNSSWDEKYFKYHLRPLDRNTYAYFAGTFDDGVSNRGTVYFMNSSFEEVHSLASPQKEADLDGHDILKKPNGNIFYLYERRNSIGSIIDNEIQERDKNGNIVFSWSAKKNLPVDMKNQYEKKIDPFHLNSIALDSDDNLILSLNGLNEIVKIAHPSGKIIWHIRQKDWNYKGDTLRGFFSQHNVQVLSNSNLLMFDNGNGDNRPSRAVEYKIDPVNKVLELVWEYRLQNSFAYRPGEGSVQRLNNGNTLIGFGKPTSVQAYANLDTIFAEVTPTGDIVRELKTNTPVIGYRVYFEEDL
jgi:hypothetical protein